MYESPRITELGSLAQLTQQTMNKVGSAPDQFTAITQGIAIGSLVPAP